MGVVDIGLCSLLLSRKPAMLWQTQDLARLLAQDPHWQAPEEYCGDYRRPNRFQANSKGRLVHSASATHLGARWASVH